MPARTLSVPRAPASCRHNCWPPAARAPAGPRQYDVGAGVRYRVPGLEARLLGAPSIGCEGEKLVVPGQPEKSELYRKVAHDKPECGVRMPVGPAMSNDEVECLRRWISAMIPGVCGAGLTLCGQACVNTATDPANCGGCSKNCGGGATCSGGSCSCPAGATVCNGGCVNTSSDPKNCGSCGRACASGEGCMSRRLRRLQPHSKFLRKDSAPVQQWLHQQWLPRRCTPCGQPQPRLWQVLRRAGRCGLHLSGAPASSSGFPRLDYLINKLTGVDMCAGSVMPKAGGELPKAQIDLIRTSICQGAPNN